jgi:hypothetical protein
MAPLIQHHVSPHLLLLLLLLLQTPFWQFILSIHPYRAPLSSKTSICSQIRCVSLFCFRSCIPQHQSAALINHFPTLGDPALIHPFLAGLGKNHDGGGENDLGAAALHLAVRCASGIPICSLSWRPWDPHSFAAETVSLLLCHRSISHNSIHPPGSGTTALHLAASLGRADVVNLLLEQEDIDDTLRDSNGKTCIDVARGKDVLSVINGTSIHISS